MLVVPRPTLVDSSEPGVLVAGASVEGVVAVACLLVLVVISESLLVSPDAPRSDPAHWCDVGVRRFSTEM
ncbi:hypothetical protein GCM10027289_15930 [Tsukamurella serpentis]